MAQETLFQFSPEGLDIRIVIKGSERAFEYDLTVSYRGKLYFGHHNTTSFPTEDEAKVDALREVKRRVVNNIRYHKEQMKFMVAAEKGVESLIVGAIHPQGELFNEE